jgi:glycosyltransferase involved in cell wall biosynthesis
MDPWAPDFDNTPVSAQRPSFGYQPEDATAAPAVSIVTPYYNTGEILLETARSVLRQSLQQWEWLLVNDGSSEQQALRVLDGFRERDPRIRVIDLEVNRGLPAARNAGVQQARADLVFFLDADDLIEPTALEKLAWCLESYPEYSFCKGLTVHFGAEEYLTTAGFQSGNLFLVQNPITIRALVRRRVVLEVGGFDETLRAGLEDWDFWLHCAAQGFWGYSIPEFLDWYRRRPDHSDRWSAWTERGKRGMRREFRRRYPRLFAKGMPAVIPQPAKPYEAVREEIPFANVLTKATKRILLILPWMAMGGADKFNLDLMDQLLKRGFEVTVATTLPGNYAWYREFAARTPDIFVLPHFLRMRDYPRFLHSLICSRRLDVVLVSHSELGYRLLPYLRSRCPDTVFVDLCHMEEEHWNDGGHPRQAVAYQDILDLNVVTSQHLKSWMAGRGADPAAIEVCYTNVDTDWLSPDPELGVRVRTELQIPADVPILLYAGRLCEQKRPRLFAQVMQQLRGRGLEFVCLVAGDGEERRWLAAYLRRHRLTAVVRMLGAVSSHRIRELLAASDILFLPSKMEGIALTIFEAMAMAVVPVSADVGGQGELVTPDCGVLIGPGEEREEILAYADALANLLHSPDRRTSMGRKARERVSTHFRLEQMGDRMVALLDKARELHDLRGQAVVGHRLATEHAVQAIEQQRLLLATQRLWKYGWIESWRWRLTGRIWPWIARASGLWWRVHRPARRLKDAIWVRGHRIKVRMLGRAVRPSPGYPPTGTAAPGEEET